MFSETQTGSSLSQRARISNGPCWVVAVAVFAFWGGGSRAEAAELLIGSAGTSITPAQPVALSGQRHTRVARNVESPVTATALALESRQGEEVLDQAIMVSCDLVAIRGDIQQQVRRRVKSRLPDFDVQKLFLSTTHTHTAPVMLEGQYVIPKEGVIQPAEYVEFLVERLADAIAQAWQSRRPGGVSWGLGHAAVAQNRRAVYADGTAKMYGKTNVPEFRGIEGYEDHSVDALFFWNAENRLTATAINVACPSQEVEGRSAVNADFWHETRELLGQRFHKDLHVLGWTGASGDQSPHLMYYKRAEERMRTLRGLTRLEEIARRVGRAVEEAHEGAEKDVRTDVTLTHLVRNIQLPVRMVTEQEYAEAKAYCDAVAKKEKPDRRDHVQARWHQRTVDRYARQKDNPYYEMELHVIRLGDVAICTNPFELYTDFGIQIKARSKAVQTFVVQLACASGIYIPTEKAVRGGGYSAEIFSNLVGPKGGQVLVDRTVEAINSMWE